MNYYHCARSGRYWCSNQIHQIYWWFESHSMLIWSIAWMHFQLHACYAWNSIKKVEFRKWQVEAVCVMSPKSHTWLVVIVWKTFISVKLKLTRQIVFDPAVQKTRKHRCNTPYVCCRFLKGIQIPNHCYPYGEIMCFTCVQETARLLHEVQIFTHTLHYLSRSLSLYICFMPPRGAVTETVHWRCCAVWNP